MCRKRQQRPWCDHSCCASKCCSALPLCKAAMSVQGSLSGMFKYKRSVLYAYRSLSRECTAHPAPQQLSVLSKHRRECKEPLWRSSRRQQR